VEERAVPTPSVERKLAAIFAADVAGYSRLMARDEPGTLARLKACRVIIDGLIATHRGRIFNTAGDSVIADFASVVDAVGCAVAVQSALGTEDPGGAGADPMRFRIGVHVGDVMVDGANLLGDGVNIAARLEALAEPGAICVSARVHEDVAGRIDASFEDLGERPLKNISRPVRVYRVRAATEGARPQPGAPTTAPPPQASSAQTLRNIGYLATGPFPGFEEFRRALAAYGYVEGKTVTIHTRWSGGIHAKSAELARELIDLGADLIVAVASPAAVAVKKATSTVPIVIVEIGDPVGYGIVPSLMRPGGNITGMSNAMHEFIPRGLRLFKDIVPGAVRVGILAPHANPGANITVRSIEEVAHALGMVARNYYASTADDLHAIFAGIL
jgi:class 3 adenylate cyclase